VLYAVAGQVPITVSGLPPVMELIKSGTLRAVALTSARRSEALTDAPILAELGPGYKDFDITNWFGMLTPFGVPMTIRTRLYQATAKALSEPAVKGRLLQQGAQSVSNSPEEFATFIRTEITKYARIVELTGVPLAP
jgi:tripartite-type tricarboxylate transporter receptor subunit TctC